MLTVQGCADLAVAALSDRSPRSPVRPSRSPAQPLHVARQPFHPVCRFVVHPGGAFLGLSTLAVLCRATWSSTGRLTDELRHCFFAVHVCTTSVCSDRRARWIPQLGNSCAACASDRFPKISWLSREETARYSVAHWFTGKQLLQLASCLSILS